MQSKLELGRDKTANNSSQAQRTFKGRQSWVVAPRGLPKAEHLQNEYKYLQTPIFHRRMFLGIFWAISLSFLSKCSPKHTQKPLVSYFFNQSRSSVLDLIFLSLVFIHWI